MSEIEVREERKWEREKADAMMTQRYRQVKRYIYSYIYFALHILLDDTDTNTDM